MIENAEAIIGVMFFVSVLCVFVLFRMRKLLGKTFDTGLKVIFGRIKNPGTFLTFFNHKFAGVEFRDTQQVHHLIETDPASPVITLDKKNVYRTYLNLPTYILYDGQPTSVDPLKYVVSFAEFERLGLIFNKALEAEEQRLAIRYRTFVIDTLKRIVLLGYLLVGLAIIILFLQYSITQFVDMAQKNFEHYKPIIDEAVRQVPRIVPTGPAP